MDDINHMDPKTLFNVCSTSLSMNCSQLEINLSDIMNSETDSKLSIVKFGHTFYGYATPIILAIGMFGNTLSLCVFLSKTLRSMSASRYLAALSTADMCTLVFYVFIEWLRRGVKHITSLKTVEFLDVEGICQLWLYLNYFSRFMSAWLIVCFTCERFVGVCMPLRRRSLVTLKKTNKIIAVLTIVGAVLVVYKPFLSEVHTARNRSACTRKQSHVLESFILDSIYGFLITVLPFLIISTLNFLIVRKLISRYRRQKHRFATEENNIRLEFTFILLAISFFFIALNVPYFAVWFRNFLHSQYFVTIDDTRSSGNSVDYWNGVLYITRTIFYMNYSVNFFLYSITGSYFRKELKRLFFRYGGEYERCNHLSNNAHETHLMQKSSRV